MTPSHLLQVLSGTATPPTLALQAGVELAPQSLGRAGMWFVDGEGVLDVHGYVYWDGAELFVQSHDPQRPIFAGGGPVPLEWTPVGAPVVLQLGQVQISFSAVGPVLSDAPTQLGQSAPFHGADLPSFQQAAAPFGEAPQLLGAPPKAATLPPPGGKTASQSPLKNPRQLLMLGAMVVMLGAAGWLLLAPATEAPPAPGKVATPTPPALTTAAAVVVAPPAPREAIPLVPATPLAKGAVAAPTELRLAIDTLLAGREAEALRMFDALSAKYPGHPELQASALVLRGLRPSAK